MSGHSILLSVGLSIGLHVIALSGASFLLPNSDSNPYAPVEVVLVEFSEPAHNSGEPIASVDAAKSAPPEMSQRELETANDTVPFPKEQHDAADIPATVEEPAAKPVRVVVDSQVPDIRSDVNRRTVRHSRESGNLGGHWIPGRARNDKRDTTNVFMHNSAAYGDQVVALPTDVESSTLDETSGRMRSDVRYVSSTPPRYPRLARKRGWEGTVLLEVEVLSSGNVGTIHVVRSSGHKVLDRAATRAVHTWRFSLNRADSSGVTATVEIPVTFELDSPGVRNRG